MNLMTRIAAGVAAAAMVSVFGLSATTASAAPSAPASTVSAARAAVDLPVVGTLADGSAFTGALSQLVTSEVNGVPMLSGVLTGTGLPVAGVPFTTAISSAQSTCRALTLNLAPLDLPVLGSVKLAPVNLVADAGNGLGNLLGNLVGSLRCLLGGLLPTVVSLPLVGPLLGQVIPALGLGPVLGLG